MNQFAQTPQALRVNLRSLMLPVVAACLLLGVVTFGLSHAWWRHAQWGSATSLAQANAWLVVPALGVASTLGIAFIIARGRLLAISAGLRRNRDGMRLFAEGTCVECLAFPGKVWADAYRAIALRIEPTSGVNTHATLKSAMSGVLRFRIGTIMGGAMVLLLATMSGEAWHAGLAMIALGALSLVASLRMQQSTRDLPQHPQQTPTQSITAPSLLSISLWGALGSLLQVASAAMVVYMITGVSPLAFVPLFVLVSLAASATTLPLGLGFAEVGGWWVLTRMLGVDGATAALAVATYRVGGPGLTLLIGATSLAHRAARGMTTLVSIRREVITQLQAREERADQTNTLDNIGSTEAAAPASNAGRTQYVTTTLVESKFADVASQHTATPVPHFTPPAPVHALHEPKLTHPVSTQAA